MRVHIGGDHAAYEMKADLVEFLTSQGHDVVDHGALTYDELDDYPVFCLRAAQAVAAEPDSLGVVLGGSGNGEQIAANKVKGVRAALASTVELATLAREHNDARVISIGGRQNTLEEARAIVAAFLATPFSGAERHQRRIDMLTAYEQDGLCPRCREQAFSNSSNVNSRRRVSGPKVSFEKWHSSATPGGEAEL